MANVSRKEKSDVENEWIPYESGMGCLFCVLFWGNERISND
jgi:hypothetical protein